MKLQFISKKNIYYGWYIVAAGTLCILGCLGFGRFALGMLLPAMAPSLNINYSQMGLISTANFIGYLISVLLCSLILKKITPSKLIFFALIVVGLSMIAISAAQTFTVIIILYFITGVGSGLANVPMMSLIPMWFSKKQRGRAAGFVAIGSGFAIILSGWMIPHLNNLLPQTGWRLSWQILGTIVLIIAVICLKVIKDKPAEITPACENDTVEKNNNNYHITHQYNYTKKNIAHLSAIYFCFGSSYVIYATFIVMSMVGDKGISENKAGFLWSMVGILSLLSGPVLGFISDKFSRRTALILVFLSQTFAYLFAALPLPDFFLYLSIFFYGFVVWSIPTIMTALVSDIVGPQKTASIFGLITFVFALGQISGPAIAGYLAEFSGDFSSGFLMAAIITMVGTFLSSRLAK